MPVGLFAHQMGVPVGVDMQLPVKPNATAFHGVDVPRRLREEIEFMGNEHKGEIQRVEDVDEFFLGG